MRYTIVLVFILFFDFSLNAQVVQNFDNRFALAQSYEQAGQLGKAEAIYRELAAAQPWNNIFFESLNKILISQKKYNESIEFLTNKIKQTPNDFNSYGLLGSTYSIMDQTNKAFETWDKGISINPTSFVSYRVIANYAIENRAFEKAIDLLKLGKKYSEDPTMFSIDLANIYAVNMKFKDAATEFCNLIIHHPEQVQTAKARMNSYLKGPGAAEQSIEAVKDFINSKPQMELYDLLTFIYQTSGDYEDAFENVTKTEERFKGNGTQIFIFAQEAYRSRQYEWASKSYDYIIKHYPGSQFFSTAKIGFARTLEALLDQKFYQQNESWKPFAKPVPVYTDEYNKIINVYFEFVKGFPDNAINIEALFRIAEIYRNRIFDYQAADSIYNRISLLSPLTNYYVESNISRGIIAIMNNDLSNAQKLFEKVIQFPRIDPNGLATANFNLARIEFWKGNFTNSVNLLDVATKNLSTDFANDALELAALINITKKDSLNLLLYAHADMLAIQNKHKDAGIELKTLSDNPNLFIINDFAKNKFAEVLIAQNELPTAIKVLEDIMENQKNAIFIEKSTFLLAQCYQYGIKNLQKAAQIYQKLLETFPNSLYFDRAREALQSIPTNNG